MNYELGMKFIMLFSDANIVKGSIVELIAFLDIPDIYKNNIYWDSTGFAFAILLNGKYEIKPDTYITKKSLDNCLSKGLIVPYNDLAKELYL